MPDTDGTLYDPDNITVAEKLALNEVISNNPNTNMIKKYLWRD